MFATVLKEITGYFDRRALLSTFLPTLVAASALVIGVALAGNGMRTWSTLSALTQALLIAGFLVLVTMCSFVLVNLRSLLDQSLQGGWGRATIAVERRVKHHRARRDALIEEDERLERLEAALVAAEATMPVKDAPAEAFTGDASEEMAKVATAWEESDQLTLEKAASCLPGLSARLSALATSEDPALDRVRFATSLALARRGLARRFHEVRTRRAAVQQRLFVLYPDEPLDVAPTGIGNIMLAAEQHPRVRYGLDPVVIWSRLQPLLPEPFSAALRDAKASLDLMLTLAIHVPVAGLPLAVLAAANLPLGADPTAWTALVAALLSAAGLFRLCRLAVATMLSVPLLSLPVLLWSVDPVPGGVVAVVLRTALGLVLAGALTSLTRLLLAGAREAALAFADQLKAAFDLHRRLVIHELGLEPPADLPTERALWLDICVFLYRGDPPTSPAFRYRAPEVT
ncbi:hypothetical protein [Streptosporangium sp. OZ121]|uniref:hypothetical protein n=1 Tax=Streptosporangium sp. OZ121 TaxID=3444183 RepID=UPI003F79CEAF